MDAADKKNKKPARLRIDYPARYGVLIEKALGMETSLYRQVYEDAKENVKNIILANERKLKDDKDCRAHQEEQKVKENFINTTIAFVGERGTGKSSSMASFASWLSKNGRDELYKEPGYQREYEFYSLQPIDANQLGKNETIIGRISAALMIEYDKHKSKLSTEERRDFITTAHRVNDLAVKYCSGTWFKSSDTLVDDTVSISQMKNEVEKLIQKFLKIQNKCIENNYLVVSIDDLDMGINNSYSIMEEIRKFLCVLNVIVLVSLNAKQLEMILKANYARFLGAANLDASDMSIVKSLSYRYIEKLFPYGRQHRMPEFTLSTLMNTESENFMNDNDKKWESSGIACMRYGKAPSIFNATLHMIWRKTMLIPVVNEDGDHLLIPRNLRSLYNLVVFLRNLPDAIESVATQDSDMMSDESKYEIAWNEKANNKPQYKSFPKNMTFGEPDCGIVHRNLDAFKEYLLDNLETFEVREMSTVDQDMAHILLNVIKEFPDMTLRTMNSKIVADILYNLQSKSHDNMYRRLFFVDHNDSKERYSKETESDENLLAASVYPDSISIGDVMYVIGKIDAKTKCLYIRYLIEVIRTLWSIEMTKGHYRILEGTGNEFDFKRAVGGLVINPDRVEFWPVKESNKDNHWFVYDRTENKGISVANLYDEIKNKSEDVRNNVQWVALSMAVCVERIAFSNSWRMNRIYGQPYYERGLPKYSLSDSQRREYTTYMHPYALFTHVLHEGNLVDVHVKNDTTKYQNVAKEICSELGHNMPMPLYSMDFMCRWYGVMKQYMKSSGGDNYIDCFCRMFDFEKAVKPVLGKGENDFESIMGYIPESFIEKVITTPLNCIRDKVSTYLKPESKELDAETRNIIRNVSCCIFKDYSLDEDWKKDQQLVVKLLTGKISDSSIKIIERAKSVREFKAGLRNALNDLNGLLSEDSK